MIRFSLGGYVDKLLAYIETSAGRNKVISVIERFTLIGGTIMIAAVLTALYFK